MRRLTLCSLAIGLLLGPATLQAQEPRLMLGGGISNPIGDLGNGAAATGFHGHVGLQIGIPTAPIALRGDAHYHDFGEGDLEGSQIDVLSGALSAVLTLPGLGIVPYVLAGIGAYRIGIEGGGVRTTNTETGFHGGFGVNLGAIGFGGYAEIRFIGVGTAEGAGNFRYIPLTVGIRL